MAETTAPETAPIETPASELPPDVLDGFDPSKLPDDDAETPAEAPAAGTEVPAEVPAEPEKPAETPAEPAPAPAPAEPAPVQPEPKPAAAPRQPDPEPEGPTPEELQRQYATLIERKEAYRKEMAELAAKEDFDALEDGPKLSRAQANFTLTNDQIGSVERQWSARQQAEAQRAERQWSDLERQHPGVPVRKLWEEACAQASAEFGNGAEARGVATYLWKQKMAVAGSRPAQPAAPRPAAAPAAPARPAPKPAPRPGGKVAPAQTVPARSQPRDEDEMSELVRNLRGKTKDLAER